MPIDMRSDTVTKPTAAMRCAMAEAEVGDDMMGEDPTVNELERRVAEMLGKEAAVFACSGTQSNQLGVWAHCRAGDELLLHHDAHITWYEGGAPAVLSGVSCRTLPGERGMFDVAELDAAMRPDDQHFSPTRLVCFENTTNRGGGTFWPIDQLARVAQRAHALGLRTHMDGARLFNACVAGGYTPAEVAADMDSVSICFSKGLGCPMGSILVGSRDDVARARRGRKIFGGALRQAGIVAAAALHALDHHVDRLADDHTSARHFAARLADIPGVDIDPDTVATNLVYFKLDPVIGTADQLAAAMDRKGVKMYAIVPDRLRACTHLGITREHIDRAADIIAGILKDGLSKQEHDAPAGPY